MSNQPKQVNIYNEAENFEKLPFFDAVITFVGSLLLIYLIIGEMFRYYI